MILTVREFVTHLGMNPATELVGASTMVKVLERMGAIRKVGNRPNLDTNGKQTIGRPSALYEFPETVSFKMPADPIAFVAAPKKERKKKVKETVEDAVSVDVAPMTVEEVVETVAVETAPVENVAPSTFAVVAPVDSDDAIDDDLLDMYEEFERRAS